MLHHQKVKSKTNKFICRCKIRGKENIFLFYEAFMISRIQAVFDEILSYIRGLSTPEGPQAIRHEETPIRAH